MLRLARDLILASESCIASNNIKVSHIDSVDANEGSNDNIAFSCMEEGGISGIVA